VQGVLKPANTAAGGAVSEVIRLNEPPELRVANTSLVDTGSIPASRETTYGLEAGASWRNLYAAGEWFKFDIDRTALVGAPSPFDPSLSGWYLQGAWTITGERHVWTPNTGGFRGIVQPLHPFDPANGGWGGWELAARYTVLDLNDDAGAPGHATPIGGVRGGEQDITTVGVNFYPNSLLRFLLDYQSADIKRLSSAGANAGEHENAVSARAQFTF
jgi:phosphate-selective porin OprO/OprP